MKKITSAALLALKLTWLAALAFTLTGAAVQIFYVFRELMPGGVPLQTTFGFEQLLQSAAERVGKFWMVLLLYMLGMDIGKSVGNDTTFCVEYFCLFICHYGVANLGNLAIRNEYIRHIAFAIGNDSSALDYQLSSAHPNL